MNRKESREPKLVRFKKKIQQIPLFWQLVIAFSLIILLAGGCVFLALGTVLHRTDPAREHPIRMGRCARSLADHYDQRESWEGVDALIATYPCGSARHGDNDSRDVAILATMDGTIVAAGDAGRLGQTLSDREKEYTTPVWVDGKKVGLLLTYELQYSNMRSDGPTPGFCFTGLFVAGATLIVGLFLSRRISRPLVDLTAATRAMAAGDLDARVPVCHRGEMRELAVAFNQMADQVGNTIVTLRRFIADAAHEIHTPLTGLSTSLELAPDNEFVKQARVQVEQLEALTGGLLDLSRIEANKQTIHTSIALDSLIEEVSERYASWAEQADLSFEMMLPETPVTVQGDEAQLRRALDNLLDNAIKFTPEGGTVSVGLYQEEEWVEIVVKDTGIGIPEDDLPHLFSRFHRGRNTAAYPGNGLGLAIVKAIAETHKGQVAAENTGQGARFTLKLAAIC
jgi:signal transduction histidine kinase